MSEESPALTAEDERLVELVASGMTDEQIARHLGTSVATMQRRLRKVSDSLGATSRVNIVVRAMELGVTGVFARYRGDANPSPSPGRAGFGESEPGS